MIKLVKGMERNSYPSEIEQMFSLRKKVFYDRLGWDVRVKDGWECDQFDDLNPLYVLKLDDDGYVVASLRLLPTTGPNMLCDIFPELAPRDRVVRGPTIWESSRFCLDHGKQNARSPNHVAMATAEIMSAVCEVGLASGLTHVVAVTDIFLERIFRQMGCPGERLGQSQRIGKSIAVVLCWEVSEQLLKRGKSIARLHRQMVHKNSAACLQLEISSYFAAQPDSYSRPPKQLKH
jgi:N-acyl-L-homoserine lactone synthetase